MATVLAELAAGESPLRLLVDGHDRIVEAWRQQLKHELPDRARWLPPMDKRRASVVGMAVDYRARWFLEGLNALPDAVELGLAYCRTDTTQRVREQFQELAGLGAGSLGRDAEVAIARLAVACATVEPLYRRGGQVRCPLEEVGWDHLMRDYKMLVDDAVRLASELPRLLGRYSGMDVNSGPDLGTGTLAADGDILVGETLLEIKCVADPMSEATKTLRQAFVYAARAKVTSLGLVLPRQRTCVQFDLEPLRAKLDRLDQQICQAYVGSQCER